jgi:sulfur-oxidizing protein SoxX
MSADERRNAWLVCAFMGIIAGCVAVPPADSMAPLAASGDATRGREVFVSREGGHCVLCHVVPGVDVAGDVGPALAGVGARLDAGQLRLRVADITRVKPDAAMPSFHRTQGLKRVAPGYAGKTALTAQQVEDIVAYLGTLR